MKILSQRDSSYDHLNDCYKSSKQNVSNVRELIANLIKAESNVNRMLLAAL